MSREKMIAALQEALERVRTVDEPIAVALAIVSKRGGGATVDADVIASRLGRACAIDALCNVAEAQDREDDAAEAELDDELEDDGEPCQCEHCRPRPN